MFASANIKDGDFPPSSSVTRLRLLCACEHSSRVHASCTNLYVNIPLRRKFLDLLSCGYGAREADLVNVHMTGQCSAHSPIASDDVDNTRRETGLLD